MIHPLDIGVIGVYLLVVLGAGVILTRRAGRSVDDFFVGGRTLPWWLVGISMAATNFSVDTPIAVTEIVSSDGVQGLWFMWSSAISALLVTFLFARLWRRSGVLTDAEIIEERYSGPEAAGLRLFKGLYFGLLFNAFIMGWVFLALLKVLASFGDFDPKRILLGTTILVLLYSVSSGFYGVILTDFVQYFVALAGSLVLAFSALKQVGGPQGLMSQLHELGVSERTEFLPRLDSGIGTLSVFATYLLVQWWAHKYADGGGKHIQRMLSAKSEQDAFGASLLYSFLNYALQLWPWIITALVALVLFPSLEDPGQGYSRVMVEVLPPGLLGLSLVGLLGAFMSTIDTHLNLGASYLVNDLYRRFLVKDASAKHYVLVSRLSMVLLLAVAAALALRMETVSGAWKFLLTFASGAGLTWILRWFWWRISAWSEISAMVASGVFASWIGWFHGDWPYSARLGVTVGLTSVVWILVTLFTRPTTDSRLRAFHRKIKPGSLGWKHYGSEGGPSPYLGRALRLWALALMVFFSLNFAIGSFLFLKPIQGGFLTALAALSGWRLVKSLTVRRAADPR